MDEKLIASFRNKIKENTLDSAAFDSARVLVENTDRHIEAIERLIAARQSLVDQIESWEELGETELATLEFERTKIQENLDELGVAQSSREKNKFLATVTDNLLPFDLNELPQDVRSDFGRWVVGYEQTHNTHYVIEIFCRLVRSGFCPPSWVLDELAAGFHDFLASPNRNPKELGKKLNLESSVSGATGSWRERDTRSRRADAMADMGRLMSDFGLSMRRAAKAVHIKYASEESEETLRKYFTTYFGDSSEVVSSADSALPLTDIERTKFVSSFPVKARKLLKP